ncbi:hypothetical protein B5F40_07340 [Gordonibacter sp. An230]|nr:hypothetical protein B5F40_07340 [Gordonibacter sp. An230]
MSRSLSPCDRKVRTGLPRAVVLRAQHAHPVCRNDRSPDGGMDVSRPGEPCGSVSGRMFRPSARFLANAVFSARSF